MPVSFKPSIPVIAFVKTAQADLIECTTPGCGYNPAGKVAINVNDPVCQGTGFLNFWTEIPIVGFFSPKEIKRWNHVEGGFTFLGECGVKFDPMYASIVDRASFLRLKGVDWNFRSLSERGSALGNDRRAYALTRKD